jgi:hypothetical protein
MGVNTSEAGVGAFLALIVAVIVIGIVYYARRHGYLQSRGALIVIAIAVVVLVAYGMSGGLLPLT